MTTSLSIASVRLTLPVLQPELLPRYVHCHLAVYSCMILLCVYTRCDKSDIFHCSSAIGWILRHLDS